MYPTKIRLSAISALLFTIFVKHGDAFSLAEMLEALFGDKPKEIAEVPKSSYVSLFPQTRRHWNEYDDLYEDSNEFHPSNDQYHPAGYYSPRDEYHPSINEYHPSRDEFLSSRDDFHSSRDEFHQSKDDFHSSEEDKSDNDIPKISVVYNNIFLMPHRDNNKENELPNVQEQNPDIRDSSFDFSMCLNPANWATCASHLTGFVNKEYKRPDANSAKEVLRAVLDFLGNKSILKSENEQRAPPIEPTSVANRNITGNETLKSAESRNITKLEKPTGRDLNSRNTSVPDINVAKSKSPLTTGHEKAKISPGNSTYIPHKLYLGRNHTSGHEKAKISPGNSTYIPHKLYLGRNHTSGSPKRSGNSTVHLSRGDKNKLDKID